MKESELVIIGAGPGGGAAAIEAARAGVEVTLLDENEQPGGQCFRYFAEGFRVTDPEALGPDYQDGQSLLHQFDSIQDNSQYLNNTLVWGIFKDRTVALAREGTTTSLVFKHLEKII